MLACTHLVVFLYSQQIPPMMPKPQRPPARQSNSPALSSHERPLVDDIRWLGRILGDIIREQEGDKAFALVEQIRRLSVAFRRDADTQAGTALKKLLAALSSDQAVSVSFTPPIATGTMPCGMSLTRLNTVSSKGFTHSRV